MHYPTERVARAPSSSLAGYHPHAQAEPQYGVKRRRDEEDEDEVVSHLFYRSHRLRERGRLKVAVCNARSPSSRPKDTRREGISKYGAMRQKKRKKR